MSKKPTSIVVLASGNGSNFQAIIDSINSGSINANIVLLITNNPEAYCIERALKSGIPFTILPDQKNRDAYAEQLLIELRSYNAELICLAGFMRVLSPLIVNKYRNKIINIHPSLLPAFPGLNAIEQALSAGVKETGATVHFVDEGVDTGPIILQESIEILPGENKKSLQSRIQKVEHLIYPQAIKKLLETSDV